MARAYQRGWDNAAAGRVVYEGAPIRDSLDRALCQAGFEDQRIARRIGRYPVRLHYPGRATYWLVGPSLYQATNGAAPAMNGAGYRDLGALVRLKGD